MIEAVLFYILAIVAVVSAISVISQRSPMSSVISLVVCFFALAVLYLLLNAHFVAALQVIVYAGAIMVLFLFVIMMLNLRGPEAPHSFHGLHKLAAVALVLCLVLLVVFGLTNRAVLGEAGQATEEAMAEAGNTEMLADLLFQRYLLPFEAVSILLLAAIVGAIVMASRRFERPDHEADPDALSAEEGDAAMMTITLNHYLVLSDAALHHRCGRGAAAPQRDRHLHVHRTDAQRGEPVVRRLRPPCSMTLDGQVFVLFDHGRGRRRGGGGPGDHHRHLQQQSDGRRRTGSNLLK